MENKNEIDAIITKYKGKKGATIPLLQDLQSIEGFLSREIMQYASDQTGIKIADMYGVATFYSMFRLKPQGRHIIKVCKGTACHVSGAETIFHAIQSHLGLTDLEDTTDDGKYTVMEVACLGCCSLAPVMMIDEETHGKLTPDSVGKILDRYE
ncbi:MAG: NADH-quinone oxidoreductase subunit NuoE [Candidatus Cloacimonetes bacterium]|nr:NADH-quinone oxidoreductase subunit NuoE [Candidatus Cloacimonadota bacterium]